MNNLGKNIRHLRELRNYTQAYVASQLGISQRAYSKIEQCADNISMKRLQHIAQILSVSVKDIIDFEDKLSRILTIPTENILKLL
ncbi:MAG: helix-turn-helix transcriptional regulator [Sphingobacteriales bacterium]|nr:helix-turn-helix transcriptional regulator [Sphingobacteriales bacterium]